MPLSVEGPARTFRQNVTLAVLLASVAGAVNAVGFFVLGAHTSHMSGTMAALGESLGTGDLDFAKTATRWALAFVAGATAASLLVELGRRLRRGRYVAPLALEAGILLWVAAEILGTPGRPQGPLVALLCFAMGMQNALVTRISNAVIRTTHLTGVLTDVGIGLISLLSWFRFHREHVASADGSILRALRQAEPLRNLWLHFALIASFVAGATLGPVLLHAWDGRALAAPVSVLVLLIVLDLRTARNGDEGRGAAGGA